MINVVITYKFGYGKHHRDVWFYRKWEYAHDTMHDYWYQDTLGMDGVTWEKL